MAGILLKAGATVAERIGMKGAAEHVTERAFKNGSGLASREAEVLEKQAAHSHVQPVVHNHTNTAMGWKTAAVGVGGTLLAHHYLLEDGKAAYETLKEDAGELKKGLADELRNLGDKAGHGLHDLGDKASLATNAAHHKFDTLLAAPFSIPELPIPGGNKAAIGLLLLGIGVYVAFEIKHTFSR